jgi:hypothetical protein
MRLNLLSSSLLIFLLFVLQLSGCASVPSEVVKLSYVMGEDLGEIHRSYVDLIELHFDDLRNRTRDFLIYRWQPTYLRNFIHDGDLTALASDPDPSQVLVGVQVWVEIAMEEIQAKHRELLDPLDQQEQELLLAVNDGFDRLITANSVITAHLNSIQEVKEVQGDALKAMRLPDLRDRINKGLVKASQISERGIQQTIEAGKIISEAQEMKKQITSSPGGRQ